jgi:hypothetical protein
MKVIHRVRKHRLLVVVLFVLGMAAAFGTTRFIAGLSLAASPASGTVSPASPTVTYTGGSPVRRPRPAMIML